MYFLKKLTPQSPSRSSGHFIFFLFAPRRKGVSFEKKRHSKFEICPFSQQNVMVIFLLLNVTHFERVCVISGTLVLECIIATLCLCLDIDYYKRIIS